jgi:hypothetical protein
LVDVYTMDIYVYTKQYAMIRMYLALILRKLVFIQ